MLSFHFGRMSVSAPTKEELIAKVRALGAETLEATEAECFLALGKSVAGKARQCGEFSKMVITSKMRAKFELPEDKEAAITKMRELMANGQAFRTEYGYLTPAEMQSKGKAAPLHVQKTEAKGYDASDIIIDD